MPHYGHPLRFGVEIRAGLRPGEAIDLAVLAEDLGFDVVLLSDPGDDSDPLTLASWVAARTERIHLLPRLAADARPASTVARAAGSLQLLSGGRAEAAFTGDASTDAVAVVRALHDTSRRSRVSHHGEHHRLFGAEAGPTLEREVPLWVTDADLAGQVADGWITDLAEVDLIHSTAALDAAATQAGRDPREIRRAVTAPALNADTVTQLVLDHGVSTVLLTSSDPADLPAFIAEVAPDVRDRIAAAGIVTTRPPRRADVRARRQPGIGYDDVPADLAEAAVEPGDAAYARVRSTYLRGGNPGLVLRPGTVEEVVSAVGFARTHRHLPLGIRSGGHGISGRSTNDGGLVIDVGRLDEITVLDEAARLVRIGPGARWRDVARELQPHGWALSSGDYGGVGVGGLATAGGIGFLARKHGLTIDHLRAVEMVLADGTRVRASDDENPELFWGVRGAGANLGIATAFEFVVDEVGDVGWAQLAFRAPDPAAFLEAYGRVVAAAPRDTTPFLILGQGVAQVMAMVDSADPDVIISQLQPFAEIAPLAQQQVVIAPYAAVMNMFPETPHDGRGEPVSRSAFTREITPGFASASAELIRSGASHWYQLRAVGGAVADVASDATAYAHRDAGFSLAVMGANAQRLDQWFEPVRRQSQGLYLSFESDRDPARLTEAFPPETLARLRRLKAQVDPHNLYQDNFNIAPEGTS